MIRRGAAVPGLVAAIVVIAVSGRLAGQTSGGAAVEASLGRLVAGDLATRTQAARDIRRAPRDTAVPALQRAVRTHPDEYVRFQALVLLTGFDDAGTDGLMREIMPDRNDRLRTVAYQWFERHPAPPVLPALIAAADRENTEFVRPALMRALAAQCGDARARAVLVPLVTRGEDLFRGAVIEALGDYHCTAAVPAIAEVAALDGPLQDDALTALGLVGGPVARRALETARPAAPRELQPTISASLCLSGGDCDREMKYIADTFTFALADPSYQPLLRGAVHAMTTLALHGKAALVDTLLDAGVPAVEPARAAIALGVGRIALRDPPLVVDRLLERNDHDGAFELMLDAFDMLSEDFDEEQFFVETRRAYWAAPAGSARQKAADALIQKLEF